MKRNLKVGGCIAIAVLGGLGPTASATNLQIDVTYDNTVTSLSNATQFESDFNAVVSQFEDAITNPVTVDIQVSVGTINGITTPLPSGDVSGSFSASVLMGSTASASFADTEAALAHTGAVLPAIDPTGGGHFYYMPQAEVKALGLSPATFPTSAPYDGYIGFSGATGEFSFSGIPSAGQYSFQTAAMHEIQEVLGRTSTLNGVTSGFAAYPLDRFRYVAPGVTSFTQNTAAGATQAYASADGGVTDLGTFADQSNGFDRSDWETPVNTTSTDAQNAILTPGVVEGLSISDEDVLRTLGYTIAPDNGGGLFNGENAPVGATASVNQSQPMPEPASFSLLWAGLVVVGLVRRCGSGRCERRLVTA